MTPAINYPGALAAIALTGLACLNPASIAHAQQLSRLPTVSTTQSLTIAGLKAPAQILVDRWGVPHIYAKSQDDAFFVQGFNAARDRLFQIDLWRRRGLGRLSSIFGPGFVEQDRAARLFLFRGDMQKEWQSYGKDGKDTKAIAGSFVAGINAYIDLIAKDPKRLPFEFRYFNYAPEKWQAEDVVRIRSHGLTRNLLSEVSRAIVACHADLKSDEIRAGLSPKWETKIPEGLDPCIPPELLRIFSLATQGVVVSGGRSSGSRADAGEPLRMVAAESNPYVMEGSNNWVVGPGKSATGRPILANDPHRAYSAPSLRYIAHLNAPGMDVIGAGEPVLPGISIGHNGTIAFGLTIFPIDQEDLYVYELNPANPNEYKYQGKWEKFVTQKETLLVRNGEARTTELVFTRHGPVIYVEKEKNRAFAVRAGWLEPGMAPYFGSIDYMYAKNFDEFKHAMHSWGAPSENQVYADTKGNIAWVAGGQTPIRPNWDGLMPVPGDGRYEWAGFLAGDKLPFSLNPPQGWFSSSNELNLPADYPYQERKLGFEWPLDARKRRSSELLSKAGKHTVEDSMRMQNDLLSTTARRLVALLKPLKSDDANTQAALQLLKSWDCIEKGDSAATALFEVWWTRYLGAVFKNAVLSKAAAALIPQADTTVLIDNLEKPDAMFGKDAVAKRNEVLLKSLAIAYADAQKLLGPDAKQWQWNKLHYALIEHPLANATDAATKSRLNVGPFPKEGSTTTLNLSSFSPITFQQAGGPSFRVVLDVGNWDNSRAVNSPGQSGDPESPHYRDLAPMWLKGEYFPLLYSRKAIEAATILRIELTPGK
jgi:penicillin amidase